VTESYLCHLRLAGQHCGKEKVKKKIAMTIMTICQVSIFLSPEVVEAPIHSIDFAAPEPALRRRKKSMCDGLGLHHFPCDGHSVPTSISKDGTRRASLLLKRNDVRKQDLNRRHQLQHCPWTQIYLLEVMTLKQTVISFPSL
jgi:hypothetical protein